MNAPRLFVLAAALSAACGSDGGSPTAPSGSATVEYHVEGVPRASLITINNQDDGTSQFANVALPWTRTLFSLPPGRFLYVSAQNDGTSGCIRVKIVKRGETYRESQSCGAFVIASVSGTV